MKKISNLSRDVCGVCAAVAALSACSGGGVSPVPPTLAAGPAVQSGRSGMRDDALNAYVYVSNRSQDGSSQLLVYREGLKNGAPIATVTKGIVDAEGIAVDSTGNVYVANGRAGNVLEFAPGGTSLLQTYSRGLSHPVDIAVANGTLYVSDQGSPANGYAQQVLEYAAGPVEQPLPKMSIAGLGDGSTFNEGIAVTSTDTVGKFFTSDSSFRAMPPTGGCPGTSLVAKNIFPTLWEDVPLSKNQQASGLAFDSSGKLYASDFCKNTVEIYTEKNYVWTHSGKLAGTFDEPLFLTIDGPFLAVPSAGSPGSSGYVSVIDLTSQLPAVTITRGLEHPTGAAVGFGS